MKEFFAMGGYAFFVWSSYALTLIVMVSIAVYSRLQRRRAVAAAKRQAVLHEST